MHYQVKGKKKSIYPEEGREKGVDILRQIAVKSVDIFSKAIDDAARRRHVKEGHRRAEDIV